MPSPFVRRLATVLWTDDRRTRIRLKSWSLAVTMYASTALMMGLFVPPAVLAGWTLPVFAILAVFHLLIRSEWSVRLADPSMTVAQIVFGIMAVMAGYTIAGEARSAVLFPLMLILAFGAFSVPWRRMAALAALALFLMGGTMLGMHAAWPGRYSTVVDLSNFLVGAIVLPGASALAMLLGALRARLRTQRTELQAALARNEALATRDDLTGLPNRRHAQELLEAESRRNQRSGQPFSIALIDLDHFKWLNDAHGHAGGDDVLRHFSDEARDCVRGFDLLARWGGEEFLLLMPDTRAPAAVAVAERLRLRVEAIRMHAAGPGWGAEFSFTCSAGVSEHVAGQTIAETLSRADSALYRAKAAGRNRVELAPPGRTGATAQSATTT